MLALPIFVAVALLLLLYARRSSLVNRALDLRAVTLPSPLVVERIFSNTDANYVKALPQEIRARFKRDRRTLAITWIRQIRQVTLTLSRMHARGIRGNASLQLDKELRVVLRLVSLLVTCELLTIVVSTVGPVQARVLLRQVAVTLRSLQAELQTSPLAAYNAA